MKCDEKKMGKQAIFIYLFSTTVVKTFYNAPLILSLPHTPVVAIQCLPPAQDRT